jgi:hypothetical protein
VGLYVALGGFETTAPFVAILVVLLVAVAAGMAGLIFTPMCT